MPKPVIWFVLMSSIHFYYLVLTNHAVFFTLVVSRRIAAYDGKFSLSRSSPSPVSWFSLIFARRIRSRCPGYRSSFSCCSRFSLSSLSLATIERNRSISATFCSSLSVKRARSLRSCLNLCLNSSTSRAWLKCSSSTSTSMSLCGATRLFFIVVFVVIVVSFKDSRSRAAAARLRAQNSAMSKSNATARVPRPSPSTVVVVLAFVLSSSSSSSSLPSFPYTSPSSTASSNCAHLSRRTALACALVLARRRASTSSCVHAYFANLASASTSDTHGGRAPIATTTTTRCRARSRWPEVRAVARKIEEQILDERSVR